MNRVSYGRMLEEALETLTRLKENLIQLFDKENLFENFWKECPGLQECRETKD